MANKYRDDNSEPNLVKYLFSRDSAVYKFMSIARACIKQDKTFCGLDETLRREAEAKFREFKFGIDRLTPYFTDELADMTLGNMPKRAVLVVQGEFGRGFSSFMSTIGYDLGTHPHIMYHKKGVPGNQTLDDYLTIKAVKNYMGKNAEALNSKGIDCFRVKHSIFFYLLDGDLKYPLKNPDDTINMEKLLPLLTDTILNKDKKTGYIGINQVTLPEYQAYIKHVPTFVNHRIKSTLARKFARQLLAPKIEDKDLVADPAGHRIVVASLGEVRDLEKRIYKGIIGKSVLKIIPEKTKDYYEEPKGNGYKALKIVAEVETKKAKGGAFVREIQLVDVAQNYKNEINPNDNAHHGQQEKKEELSDSQLRQIPEPIFGALHKIFGKPSILITLNEAMNSK